MPTPDELLLIAPIPSADFPALPPGTDLTGAFITVTLPNGTSYPATVEQLRAEIAPNDLTGTVKPTDNSLPEPVRGREGQTYWHLKDGQALSKWQLQGGAWVLQFSVGKTNVDGQVGSENAAPLVSLTASQASIALGGILTLNATASDTDGTIAKVEFYDAAEKIGERLSAPYALEVPTNKTGRRSFTAKATDNSGASRTTAPVVVEVNNAKNTAPTIKLVLSATSVQQNQLVGLDATTSDVDGTVVKVEFFDGQTLIETRTEAPFAINYAPTTPGTHFISAKATDNSGATTSTLAQTLTVSAATATPNVNPTITLTLSQPSAVVGAMVSASATASDTDGTVVKVEFFVDGESVGVSTSSPYAANFSIATAGQHFVTAKATDNLGGTTVTQPRTLTVTATSNALPNVSVAVSPASIVLGATTNLVATANDPDGTISKVEFYAGGSLLDTLLSAPYTLPYTPTGSGSTSITAKAYDNSGASRLSAAQTLTVSAAATPVPTLSAVSPASGAVGTSVTLTGANLTGATTLTFNGTAAAFTVLSPTSVSTTVPAGATSGNIALTTPGGTATIAFTVPIPAPSFNTTVNSDRPTADVVTFAGLPGVDFRFNSPLPTGDPGPFNIQIFLGGTQLASVDATPACNGQPCAVEYNGMRYLTTFQNGTVTLTNGTAF